jgi:hypothetical protein
MQDKDSQYREELRQLARAYRWPMRAFLSVLITTIVAMCLFVTLYNAGLVVASVVGLGASLPRLLGCAFGLLISAILVFWIRDMWLAEDILAERTRPLLDESPKKPIQPPAPKHGEGT